MKHNLLIVAGIVAILLGACKARTNEESKTKLSEEKSENKKEVVSENKKTDIKGKKVEIETTMGNITIVLYDETPLHQQNFIKLVNEKFYEGTLFHRVIKDFMIQAGDPDSKMATKGQMLGSGGPGYTINAEFNSKFVHKKGALSAARQGDQVNPEKKSSGSQFYIVQGKKYTVDELKAHEEQAKMKPYFSHIQNYFSKNSAAATQFQTLQQAGNKPGIDSMLNVIIEKIKMDNPGLKEPEPMTDEQKQIYNTIGGTPFLDGDYTVFGEVISGLDIIDKIAVVATDQRDRPLEDVKIISMKVVE